MKKIFLILFIASGLFANIGKIITLRGDVVISSSEGERAAVVNEILKEDDTISTKNNAKLQIKFIDDTIVTLGKNTTLSIKDYVIDGENSKVNLEVNNGDFKVISGQISKLARENFALQAKTATIGIRGTVFVGKLDQKVDKIGCLEGAIDVKIGNKSSLINAGKQIQFNKNNIIKIEKIKPREYETVKNEQTPNKENKKVDMSKNNNFNNFLADKEAKIKANKEKNMDYKNYSKDSYKNNYNKQDYNTNRMQNLNNNAKVSLEIEKIKDICGNNQSCIDGKLKAEENKNKYGNDYKDKYDYTNNRPNQGGNQNISGNQQNGQNQGGQGRQRGNNQRGN